MEHQNETSAQQYNLNLKMTAIKYIVNHIKKHNLTQLEAGKIMKTSQPRVSSIVNNRAEKFRLSSLVNMIILLGGKPIIHVE